MNSNGPSGSLILIRLWLHSLFRKLTNNLLQLSLVLGKSCSHNHTIMQCRRQMPYQVPQVHSAGPSNSSNTFTHVSQCCAQPGRERQLDMCNLQYTAAAPESACHTHERRHPPSIPSFNLSTAIWSSPCILSNRPFSLSCMSS